MRIKSILGILLAGAVLLGLQGLLDSSHAADWPMSRFDAQRSSASPHELAAKLHLQWVREFPPLESAWPDQASMQFDAYDPIIVGGTLFLTSSRHDWVTAFDAATGVEKWRYFSEGPIRFAPVGWQDKIYFVSDDGYLYCLDAAQGKLQWKFRGGPSDRKILGNERLISTWPARGAPVVADGKVYFAASIWPFMGTFVHALDARTGKAIWTNDGDGSIYIKQPHNTDSFAGVAPQGPLVAIGDRLLVPGGRSVPACFDLKTGKLLKYQLGENGKRGGGSEVSASGKYFFNGGGIFDLGSQKHLAEIGKQVVVSREHVFTYSKGACRAFAMRSAREIEETSIDRKGKDEKTTKWEVDEVASCALPHIEVLIKSGPRLYSGGKEAINAIDLDLPRRSMKLGWQSGVEGTVVRLATGADRLFAVTREGRLYCYGAEAVEPHMYFRSRPTPKTTDDGWADKAELVLKSTQVRDGYCVAWGIGTGRLIQELALQSSLRILVLEPDAEKVLALRTALVEKDSARISVHHGDPATFSFPPYLASLMVCEDPASLKIAMRNLLARLYPSLRPYGGKACFFMNKETQGIAELASELALAKAKVHNRDGLVIVEREGALPGAADWTHEHADSANTRVSKDKLAKAPLGVLWFGGPSHDGILPRHGHGPQPQVIEGRMIIEGIDLMRAIDIYTGRLLWETKVPGVGAFFNNLAHQPGANSAGSNFVSTRDGIYVVVDRRCLRLDPVTGKVVTEFRLPRADGAKNSPRWGYINVHGDYLIAGAEPLFNPKFLPPEPKPGVGDDPDPGSDGKESAVTKFLNSLRGFNDNFSSSLHLVVMDRHTGKVHWSAESQSGFRHNATCVGGGRLYTIDRLSGEQINKLSRRGEEPPFVPRIIAFDLKTGRELWSTRSDVFGTWLSYSAERDVLLESGRMARDTLFDEPKGMRAFAGKSGAVLWHEKDHVGPAMIHGDTILLEQSACKLADGKPVMRRDPLTGAETPWKWVRNYGCNTPAASEHLLTFRSGAAGYFDLCGDGGTGNFGGFRSSCTNNMIVAGGILTVPEYTRTCTCTYQNQTSLALIHMPDAEMWTSFGTKEIKGRITRLGLNLGAPGDHKADDGTLWLEHPSVAGTSPAVEISTKPTQLDVFRRHSSTIQDKYGWITSSGVKDLREVQVKLGSGNSIRRYTVRLYFAEHEDVNEGKRVFDVEIQGRTVQRNLDIVKEAGGRYRTLVKEWKGVDVSRELSIRLNPVAGVPILCGLEVAIENER